MSPFAKRWVLIGGLIFITFVIGFALYMTFKQTEVVPGEQTAEGPGQPVKLPTGGTRTSTVSVGTSTQLGPNGLPVATVLPGPDGKTYFVPEKETKITNDFASFTSVGSDGNVRYHNAADGKFYSIAPNGTVKELTGQVFYNVEKVTWSKASDKAVLEYPDGSNIIYDFNTNKQVSLPKHWEDFSFSPDGREIASKSIGLSPENRWLITMNDDGTGTKLIEPLGENADKVTMDWSPSRQTVAFSQTGDPQGADRKEILLVGLNGENLKSIVVEGLDFQSQWSPTGQKLLYSVDSARSEYKPELWIVNSYGDNIGSGRQMLKVNTWANKCTFVSDSEVVCGVPRELPEGAGMSPAIAADTPDDLYRIDLRTGIRTPVKLDNEYTIDTISYNAATKKVIFSDHHQTGAFEVGL
jgi:WD40 repeat protein